MTALTTASAMDGSSSREGASPTWLVDQQIARQHAQHDCTNVQSKLVMPSCPLSHVCEFDYIALVLLRTWLCLEPQNPATTLSSTAFPSTIAFGGAFVCSHKLPASFDSVNAVVKSSVMVDICFLTGRVGSYVNTLRDH